VTATCEGDTLQQAVDYAAYTCSLYVSLLRVLLLRYASILFVDLTIPSSCLGYRYSGHHDRLASGDDIHSGTGEYRSYRTDHRQDPGHFQDRHYREYPAGSLVFRALDPDVHRWTWQMGSVCAVFLAIAFAVGFYGCFKRNKINKEEASR
jgi:hypothetical protein